MPRQVTKHKTFVIDSETDTIPEVVERIKEARGLAYSKFSGRPISLCRSLERRGELRVKFEEPIYIWPVNYESDTAYTEHQQPIVAVTRDISPHGVGFSYDQAFETDHLVAEFDLYGQGTECLLIDVRWAECTAPHAYVAGGLVVGVVTVTH